MRAWLLIAGIAAGCGGTRDECADVKAKLAPALANLPGAVARTLESFCTGDDATSRAFVGCVRAADGDQLAICLAPLLKAAGEGARDPDLRRHLDRFEELKGPRKSDVERRLEQIEAEQKRPLPQ